MKKRIYLKYFLLTFCLALLSLFFISAFSPKLPNEKDPIIFYSNQCRNDLRLTLKKSLQNAKESITIIIFSFNDKKIIKILKEKARQGVDIEIICQPSIAKKLSRQLGKKIKIKKRKSKGLMHQKIIIVDGKQVWIGSSNLTTGSLVIYDNLLMGIQDEKLARWIKRKNRAKTLNFSVKDQELELWMLPENEKALDRVKKVLKSAKKTINIAMFTWTHQGLAREVIAAHKRGVKVKVVLDYNSSRGVSKKVAKMLMKSGIPVAFSQGFGILHHKLMYVDERIVINGSANWTKAAFNKNHDCFLIVKKISPKQKKFMNKLWKNICLEAKWQNRTRAK